MGARMTKFLSRLNVSISGLTAYGWANLAIDNVNTQPWTVLAAVAVGYMFVSAVREGE